MNGVSAIPLLSDSSKNAIISLLVEEQSLKAKQIHEKLEKNHGINVSYQAVHKSLSELEQSGVVTKTSSEYKIDKNWVDNLEIFAKNFLEQHYGSSDFVDTQTIVTNSLYETDMVLLEAALKMLENMEEKPILCIQWHHAWVPLFLNKKTYAAIKELIHRVDLYDLIKGETVVDKWCAKYWIERGVKLKLGVDLGNSADLVILGDHIVQVFYPQELRKELGKAFSSVSKFSELNTGELFEKVFMKPTKITIVTMRNKLLAEQLRRETMNHFKGD